MRTLLFAVFLAGAVTSQWSPGVAYGLAHLGSPGDVEVSVPQQVDDDLIERPPELTYLFAVYIITWGGFFAYAFYMSRRQREMQRELEALRRALDEGDFTSSRLTGEG